MYAKNKQKIIIIFVYLFCNKNNHSIDPVDLVLIIVKVPILTSGFELKPGEYCQLTELEKGWEIKPLAILTLLYDRDFWLYTELCKPIPNPG